MFKHFKDRVDAGNQLATKLAPFKDRPNTLVLALPRGGVPVAFQISRALNLPLDVFIVRKLGIPQHQEYAMGAIAGNDVCIFNTQALDQFAVSSRDIKSIIEKETAELVRRNSLYRNDKPMPDLHGKTVILVDDGIATGASVKVALLALEKFMPEQIILATPVLPYSAIAEIKPLVSQLVYLVAPEPFYSVGSWYESFPQVNDKEVIKLLAQTHMVV